MTLQKTGYDPEKLKLTFHKAGYFVIGRVANKTEMHIDKIDIHHTRAGSPQQVSKNRNIWPTENRTILYYYGPEDGLKISKINVTPKGCDTYAYPLDKRFDPKVITKKTKEDFFDKNFETIVAVVGGALTWPVCFTIAIWAVIIGVCIQNPNGCFVTTAAYGDENHPMVKTFRALRDEVLVNHKAGRAFIGWYEQNGPKIAATIEGKPLRMKACRAVLTPLAHCVKAARGTAKATRATKEYMKINFGSVFKNGLG